METSTKVLIGVGVGTGIVLAIVFWPKSASAAPLPPAGKCLCPDGTPCPGGDVTKCPPPKPGQNPYSPPGGWQYSGDPTKDFLPSVALLAAKGVDPCACANVGLVRRVQHTAGLTQSGKSDGRYGPDVQKALQSGIADLASQGFDVSGLIAHDPCESNGRPAWWGSPGTYTNPKCPTDPGPAYAG